MKLDHRGEADRFRRQLEIIPARLTAGEVSVIMTVGLLISAAVECARFYW